MSMDNKEIIKTIYKLSQTTKDAGLLWLEIYALVNSADIAEILNLYRKIMKGEIKIAEILTHNELLNDQKKQLEQKVNEKFKDITLIYDYHFSDKYNPGIMVRIGDDVLDGTI